MLALLRAQERLRGRARLGSGRHGDPRRSPRRPPQQPRRQSQVPPQPRPGGEGGPCGSAPSAPVIFLVGGFTSQGLGDTPSALLLPHGHLCKAGWQPVSPPPPPAPGAAAGPCTGMDAGVDTGLGVPRTRCFGTGAEEGRLHLVSWVK